MTVRATPQIEQWLSALNNPALPRIELSLARMEKLLEALGNPQERMPPAIHVAGTNGKGSTIAFLQSIYETAGYRVHRYISPHLVRFSERIVLAGQEIDEARLEKYLKLVVDAAAENPVTFFEATTAAAFLAFAEHPADVLLLEVGLGGRKDATRHAAHVVATVITPIGLDHREFLGDTLELIAAEKAGIVREDVPCISAPQGPGVMKVLCEKAPHLSVAEPYAGAIGLAGEHQRINAGVAAQVVRALEPLLPVSTTILEEGLAGAGWPARLQRLVRGPLVDAWAGRGDVRLDGGHNAHAAEALAVWAAQQPVVVIAGLMARKDAAEFLAPLAGMVQEVVFIPIPDAECHAPEQLVAVAAGLGVKARAAATPEEAAALLAPVRKATLLVAGSLYLAGEILKNHG